MKKVAMVLFLSFIIIGIFAQIHFISADDNGSDQNAVSSSGNGSGNTENEVVQNSINDSSQVEVQTEVHDDNETETQVEVQDNGEHIHVHIHGNETEIEHVKNALRERNRLRFNGTAPGNCTFAGSTMKCFTADGRTMTVTAGKSGNIIVQVMGVNATTNVTLYKDDSGRVYGIFAGNESGQVILPDQARARLHEREHADIENESINLTEDGNYTINAEKQARLFFIFSVKERIQAKINAETGNVTQVNAPWWGFLAKDTQSNLLGASCATVTPGTNDQCCTSKGYDFWNATAQECGFNSD